MEGRKSAAVEVARCVLEFAAQLPPLFDSQAAGAADGFGVVAGIEPPTAARAFQAFGLATAQIVAPRSTTFTPQILAQVTLNCTPFNTVAEAKPLRSGRMCKHEQRSHHGPAPRIQQHHCFHSIPLC
ncbi:hypothetical protein OPU71_13970 [Niveibacterium sp. 24ML]|uniref:hypothetical protein n=1 Tax=Niveibacterium sp. 24ML TaxID=2985512 RepID=UPI0022715C39|nr:hypothetical protein [Niveibacterium sp. 24ML]MCX9157234.1 hypothetical protein [Niveibacterium sp. 24ML]